jgi:hypothetical protein
VSGQLTIRRFQSEYRVERDTVDPSRIRDECDSALRGYLGHVLTSALGRWCDGGDESIWLVRRLDIELAVSTSWKGDELARVFAASIARELATTLIGDGDGVNAIRFPGPAAYLGRFLADAATGDAWSRWYYAKFDGLRTLPTSAALRTALIENPQVGLAAMQRLSSPDLSRVIGAMSAHDRSVALDRFSAATAADDLARAISDAWAAWQQYASAYTDVSARAIAVFVRAANTGCGGPMLRAAIEALDAAQSLGASCNASQFAKAARAFPLLRAASLELLEVIFAPVEGPGASSREASGGTAFTPFGGAFFLLPHLDALPFETWLESWLDPDGAAAASALRLLVMAKCMGGTRAEAAFTDAVLRRLFAIGPEFTLAAARKWLRILGTKRRRSLQGAVKIAARGEDVELHTSADERAQLALPRHTGIERTWDDALGALTLFVLRRFARRLPGFSGSRFAHLHRNFLDVGAVLEEEPERLVVRVARPPLYLVLNLTGMTRTSYAIRGEARPIAVFTQD